MTGLDRLDRHQAARAAAFCARVAARRGDPYDSCPWKAGTSNRERAMRFVWQRTYAKLRPDACGQALADGDAGVMVVAMWEPFTHGRDAAEAGEPFSACPYPLDAATAVGRAQLRAWCDGYDSVRPFPIDYSG